MSTPSQTPQVLTRRARGTANDSTKKGSGPPRSAREKSSIDRTSETSNKGPNGNESKPPRTKAQSEGEKLVVRRLPPGMTEDEFNSIIGADWEIGNGKVDWVEFVPGKVSKDPSKPSRPARAYVHILRKEDIMFFSDVVRTSDWEDAKGTFNNPSLVGPPAVEFSIYKKVPSNKKRTDARQGTIDQDPEFMAFLESLANPVQQRKEATDAHEGDGNELTDGKVTSTPLIEFLREKKANKSKEAASAKGGKKARDDAHAAKGKGATKDSETGKKKGREEKGNKASKETVKILTKKAATEQAAEAAKNAANQINAANAADAPKSRRAGIAAAARILQRDLGLSPGSAHRRARQDAAKGDPGEKDNDPSLTVPSANERPASPAPSTDSTAKQATAAATKSRRTRGGKNPDKGKATEAPQGLTAANPPVILKKKPETDGQAAPEPSDAPQTDVSTSTPATAPKNASSKQQNTPKRPVAIGTDATRAFVKHANASQGVTDALLKTAMETFGAITFVEIDKRKGFAYVDFADHEGLIKAISASPITIAQGAVQVLERKDKKPPVAQATSSPTTTTAEKEDKTEKSKRQRGGRGRGGRGNNQDAGTPTPTNGASANNTAANTGG